MADLGELAQFAVDLGRKNEAGATMGLAQDLASGGPAKKAWAKDTKKKFRTKKKGGQGGRSSVKKTRNRAY